MNATEILREAHAIRAEVIAKFPEYAEKLNPVHFRVSNAMRRALGSCRYSEGKASEITFSAAAFQHEENRSEFRFVALHEFAHAIAGYAAGHGLAWQAVDRRIGGRGERTCSTLKVSSIEYVDSVCYVCRGTLRLTRNRASRVRNGTQKYRHTTCHPARVPSTILVNFLDNPPKA